MLSKQEVIMVFRSSDLLGHSHQVGGRVILAVGTGSRKSMLGDKGGTVEWLEINARLKETRSSLARGVVELPNEALP